MTVYITDAGHPWALDLPIPLVVTSKRLLLLLLAIFPTDLILTGSEFHRVGATIKNNASSDICLSTGNKKLSLFCLVTSTCVFNFHSYMTA